ncbi:ATP-binding protein [Thiorhodovibrio frisius]|uniref:histidine kinase n=1 Tax=Thiorhodovibrio frisius TaxID=631362 RepID=H8Z7T9_9GAMM|nr:ATP-binding protein [Thiorhodovibrio frisius]EIC20951.1 signal transduction histidine kinase [Thiorhodovibrio frisius]WPL22010.1 Signal transduction histidine-protein kinase BaeS [Thiorhodovibrio frisius]
MKRSLIKTLAFKIFLVVLAGMVALVAGMLALTYTSVGRGFLDYIHAIELERTTEIVQVLQDIRARDGDWRAVPTDSESFRRWLLPRLSAPGGFVGLDSLGPLPATAPGEAWASFPPPPGAPPRNRGFPPPPLAQGNFSPPIGGPPPLPEGQRGGPRPPDRLGLLGRIALLNADGELIAGPAEATLKDARRPITVDTTVVGWLAVTRSNAGEDDLARRFLHGQRNNMLLISALSVVLSVLLAWRLAANVRRPVGALVAAMGRLADGNYGTRIPEARGDELGDLARTLNHLGGALERYEGMRRQWVADTSHELRTPITILRARIEAMQDGIHAVEPHRLGELHRQVMNLSALVDDLYTLARADLGRLEVARLPVEPLSVLDDVLEAFQPRLSAANLALEIKHGESEPASSPASLTAPSATSNWITLGDERRLSQLFSNLIENSLRYTDAGGRIRVVCTIERSALRLAFHDTLPGVPDTDLAHLFDRFYRVEGSRNRALGGSGLGLALCRTIVQAHDGTIIARPSELGGLCVEVRLPLRQPGAETR